MNFARFLASSNLSSQEKEGNVMKRIFYAATILLMVSSPLAPAFASAPTGSIGTMALTIDGSGLTITRSGTPTFSAGTIVYQLFACSTPENAETSASPNNGPSACNELTDSSGNPFTGNSLNDAYRLTGTNPNRYSRYNTGVGEYITYTAKVVDTLVPYFVHPPSVRALGPLPPGSSGQNSGQSSAATVAPTLTKYSGPEFSALSAKPVMNGTSTTLTGKRLTQVSSIEIGGKAATFAAASDTELSLTPAADLAPGNYDLVIYSSAGKLTHINAVRVQSPLKAFSITSVSEGRITNDQYIEHALIAAMQQPELTKARCIVNGPNLAQAKAQAERLCALVRASNKSIETTVVESRSTVNNNKVYARVTYGWN